VTDDLDSSLRLIGDECKWRSRSHPAANRLGPRTSELAAHCPMGAELALNIMLGGATSFLYAFNKNSAAVHFEFEIGNWRAAILPI